MHNRTPDGEISLLTELRSKNKRGGIEVLIVSSEMDAVVNTETVNSIIIGTDIDSKTVNITFYTDSGRLNLEKCDSYKEAKRIVRKIIGAYSCGCKVFCLDDVEK